MFQERSRHKNQVKVRGRRPKKKLINLIKSKTSKACMGMHVLCLDHGTISTEVYANYIPSLESTSDKRRSQTVLAQRSKQKAGNIQFTVR